MSLYQNSFSVNSSWDEKKFINADAIDASANQSVRPYGSNQEYLYAMREDLAIWLKGLYAIEISVRNFFEVLGSGTILCQHANNITNCAEYMQKKNGNIQWKYSTAIPSKYLNYHQIKDAGGSNFFARDNIATFIDWCRKELGVHESLMFETNDLILKKSEKNFILCLLEVARRGSKVGVPAPVLIQMEEDIDEEIEMEKVSKEKNIPLPKKPVKQKVDCDFKSLDEMVQYILGQCTCPTRFRMVKVSDGKYKVGGSENLIFMRILRQHVMVRVGGGWDTLEQYLNKHDPCRCQIHKNDRKLIPRHSRSANVSRSTISRERSPVYNHVVSKGSTDGGARRSQTLERPKRMSSMALTSRDSSSQTNQTLLKGLNNSDHLSSVRQPDKRGGRPSAARTSYTPTPESRQSTSKHSTPSERRGRSSTNKNENQLNVFSRLSRPKSTPPVTRNTIAFQDDVVEVKRSGKGTHRLARVSTKDVPARHTVTEKAKTKPRESNDLRSKSMVASPQRQRLDRAPTNPSSRDFSRSRDYSTSKSSKQSRAFAHDKDRNLASTSMSPRKNKPSKAPFYEEIDSVRERELLAAIEREYIENQQTLQLRKSRSRKASLDDLLDSRSTCSYSNAEDNEVAFHMQEDSGRGLLHPPSQLPSSYHSLPRPRREKSTQHERRTRIPTPVSFNSRQLLNSRNPDLNESFSSSKPAADNNLTIGGDKLAVYDGTAVQDKENFLDVSYDFNRSLERSNRSFDSFESSNVEDEIEFRPKASSESKHLNAALLHSSAHADSIHRASRTQSPFVPVENESSVGSEIQMQRNYLPQQSPAFSPRYPSCTPADQIAHIHRNDKMSSLPDHILQSCNLTSTPQFADSVSSMVDSREAQWV